MPREHWKEIVLLTFPILLLIGAFETSTVFDARFTTMFSFLQGISPLYYLNYCFVIGVLLYFGHSLFREGSRPREYLVLSYLLIFAFTVYFILLLFTNPLATETTRYGKIYYILRQGNLKNPPGHPESVGNGIFWAFFIKLTGFSPLPIVAYVAPIFMYIITIFILYTALRSFFSVKLVLLGTFFSMGMQFAFFNTERYTYAAPLFVLFLWILVRYLKGAEIKLSLSILFPIIIAVSVVTHPAWSLFTVLILVVSLVTAFLYGKIIQRRKIYLTGKRLVNPALYSSVVWFFWFLFIMFQLPGSDRLSRIWMMVVKGTTRMGGLKNLSNYPVSPFYYKITVARILIGAGFSFTPLILFFIYLFYKWHKTSVKQIDGTLVPVFASFCLLSFSMFLGALLQPTVAMRLLFILALFIPFLLLMVISKLLKSLLGSKKILKPILAQEGIGALLLVFLLWLPILTYVQVPSGEVSTIKAYSSYSPHSPDVYAVGRLPAEVHSSSLFQYLYASRRDIQVSRWINIRNLTAVKKAEPPAKGYILIDGSILAEETKYQFSPSLQERLKILRKRLARSHYNKIYVASERYNIWMKR